MSRLPFGHLVIRASAGSGKTFQLTSRYLGLLAAGVPPSHIWAATFTRKAAGEILDRIVKRLAEAASSDELAAKETKHLGRSDLTRADFARLLRTLISDLHRLRIGTLDSLFLVMAGVFTFECGLPPGWAICDEVDNQTDREIALDAVLSGDTERLEWLTKLYERLTHGEARRSVREELLSRVAELLGAFLAVPRPGWRCEVPPEPVESLDALLGVLQSVALGSDKRMTKARDGDWQRASEGQWEEFATKGLAGSVYSGDSTFYKKPIPSKLIDCYMSLREHAGYELRCRFAAEAAAIWEFLHAFSNQLAEVQRISGGLRFDDVTRVLGDRLQPEAAGFGYRIDSRVGHLLLDEFQDTSIDQWRVLRSLAQCVIASNGTLFTVGDVKQAIYGWRGGQARLLLNLPEDLGGLPVEAMDRSRRSAKTIIETVNKVFANVPALLDSESPVWVNGQSPWNGDFRPHDTARSDRFGYVHVETGPGQNDDESPTALRIRHLEWVAGEVAELVRAKPTATIGVLCRKNARVGRMLYELRRRGVAASEEGGNPITDSPAVEVILSLLTLTDHPGDKIAAFHLANSPLAEPLRQLGFDPNFPDDLASRVRRSLLVNGYATFVMEWANRLASICPASDRIRLSQLVELAETYQARVTLRPTDFVAWARAQRISAPTSSRVRVLTLHKAKGLEFDAVVLPELDVALNARPSAFVVAHPELPDLPHGFVGRRPRKGLLPLLDDVIRKQIADNDRQEAEESLSLLYVALTRPREALYIYPPGPQKRSRTDHWDTLVLKGLGETATADVRARKALYVAYTSGDPAWTPERSESAEATLPREQRPIQFCETGSSRRHVEWIAPSHRESGQSIPLARLFAVSDSAKRQIGVLHHAWFAAVEWLDEHEPTDDELRLLARKAAYSADDMPIQIGKFRESLRRPALRKLLSRSTNSNVVRVERERPFAVRKGDHFVAGRIDRLIWLQSADGTRSAELIDFKTDEIPLEAVTARLEEYHSQMQSYREAVASFADLPIGRVGATVAFTAVDRIERLTP